MNSTLKKGALNVLITKSSDAYGKSIKESLIKNLPEDSNRYDFNSIINYGLNTETSSPVDFINSHNTQKEIMSAHIQVVIMMTTAMAISLLVSIIIQLAPRISVTTSISRKKESKNPNWNSKRLG